MGYPNLLRKVLYAFGPKISKERAFRKHLALLLFIGAVAATRPAFAQTITIDGSPADWPAVLASGSIQFKTFIADPFNTSGDDVYGSGSDIIDVPGWSWTSASTNDKTDIENAGMALIGNKLYFFGDRYANNGSASIGVWILKNKVLKVAGGSFSGVHADGDLLITCDLPPSADPRHIYRWQGGSLVEVTLTTAAANIAANSGSVASPWPYTPKSGSANTYPSASFVEGFVNIDSVGGGVDICFTEFFMTTRTSQSTSASLMDLVTAAFSTRPVVTVANDTVCSGQSAVFTAVVTGGQPPYTYSWNSAAYAATSTYTISPATVNTIVTVAVHANNGCISQIDTALLVVKPLPTVNAVTSVSYCKGATGSAISFSSPTGRINIFLDIEYQCRFWCIRHRRYWNIYSSEQWYLACGRHCDGHRDGKWMYGTAYHI
jgi:hypothetical protein